MGFGVYYMIIDLGMKAGLVESCARLAVGVEIPQCSLSSVYVSIVHRDNLAQVSGSAVLNASCKSYFAMPVQLLLLRMCRRPEQGHPLDSVYLLLY